MSNIILTSESELRKLIADETATVLANLLEVYKQAPQIEQNKRLTIAQVCASYNISKPTLHKHMHKGLTFEKVGRKTLFRAESVENYFRSLEA